jgi:flagellar motility protein MotE (MotC chaperone)
MCEKCTELQELYDTAQSALDSELEQKHELAKQLAEMNELYKQLMEEKEQLSSSVKENVSYTYTIVHGFWDTFNASASDLNISF